MSSEAVALGYAACTRLARSHYENFPVASWLLPARMRLHVAAVYAFARTADDLADEGNAAPEERQARLRAWQDRLHRAAAGEAHEEPLDRDALILTAVGHSIRSLDLPSAWFDDLVSACGQDARTTRYSSWCGRREDATRS